MTAAWIIVLLLAYGASTTALLACATLANRDLAAENQRLKDAERQQQMAAHPASERWLS